MAQRGDAGSCENSAEAATALRSKDAEIERLREALAHIKQWSEAYPTNIFPEPDFKRAAEVLKAHSMTLDAISASNMRHVSEGVGNIARTALGGGDE